MELCINSLIYMAQQLYLLSEDENNLKQTHPGRAKIALKKAIDKYLFNIQNAYYNRERIFHDDISILAYHIGYFSAQERASADGQVTVLQPSIFNKFRNIKDFYKEDFVITIHPAVLKGHVSYLEEKDEMYKEMTAILALKKVMI